MSITNFDPEKPAKPFVVFGIQRSGTTLVRSLLDSHPAIRCLGEAFLKKQGEFPGRGVRQGYYRYLGEDERREALHASATARPQLVRDYLDETFAIPGFRAIGFKFMANQSEPFPEVLEYVQEHRIAVVHVVRDNALKILVSREMKKVTKIVHSQEPVTVPELFLSTRHLVRRLKKLKAANDQGASNFPHSPYLRLVYEDFRQDMKATGSRLKSFLEIDSGEPLASDLVKIVPDDLEKVLTNYDEVCRCLEGTEFQRYLDA